MLARSLQIRLAGAWLNTLFTVAPDTAAAQTLALFCRPTRRNPPAPEDAALLRRADTWRLALPGAGVDVAAYRWRAHGAAGAPPRQVLIAHGWESCVGRLAEWITPLNNAGFDVLGVDAPAHGNSAGERLTALDYVEAMRTLSADVGGSLHAIVGHSFGGLCAALAAGGIAGAPRVDTARLVVIAAPESVQTLLGRFAGMLELRPALTERVATQIEALTATPLAAFSASTLLAQAAPPLPAMLVVHDTRDEEVPYTDGERLAARIPGADFYVTTGLGHRRVARNPHVIRYAVDFLRRA